MSKKLQGNGLFESSRMMLPEHKEAYIRHQRQLPKQSRPQLDEQETERISRALARAMQSAQPVTLTLFDEFGERRVTGRIAKADPLQRKVGIVQDGGLRWIPAADILDVVF
jgi:hypothetical protein